MEKCPYLQKTVDLTKIPENLRERYETALRTNDCYSCHLEIGDDPKSCELYKARDLIEMWNYSAQKALDRYPKEFLDKPFQIVIRPDIAQRIEEVRSSGSK